jgi:hypothetical protein
MLNSFQHHTRSTIMLTYMQALQRLSFLCDPEINSE